MNIANLVGTKIYRGPQPQNAADMYDLQNLGIKFTLDLETGAHWLRDGDPLLEALALDKYGIRAYNHPLGAVFPPTKMDLVWAVEFIKDHQPVYVHCREGVDRTGMVCAAYRIMVQRWGRETAIRELKSCGMHWWYWYWIPQLDNL